MNDKEAVPQIEEDQAQSVPTKELDTVPPTAQPAKRARGRPRKNDPNHEDVMDPPIGKVNLDAKPSQIYN